MLYAIESEIKGAFENADNHILIKLIENQIYYDRFFSLRRVKIGYNCLKFESENGFIHSSRKLSKPAPIKYLFPRMC